MKNTCKPSIKALYMKNAQALACARKLDAAFTPEQMKCIAVARACFDNLEKSDTEQNLSTLIASLDNAGVGFEVLDTKRMKSAQEMEAEVRLRAGLEPGVPLCAGQPSNKTTSTNKIELNAA